ncbi:stealth family protein [Paeniglutamicibacter gangotriensis]|uniref:Capsular polysaccharide phosphotransferase SacB n=1 Tax=Paeniglutamicibacter gangotriensis Lz1y TaxID=1276920 RepID=M7MP27_9MICC|nr:stealth family protein [Paeniglutamicibacter gangotriensis]EMQ96695.1 Capsular polysaccharide phosphotransferase SacB [Paeniglutamicibacter gangotriensis Lz1y]
MPWEIAQANFFELTTILDRAEIDWFLVRSVQVKRLVVAVDQEDKYSLALALASSEGSADCYIVGATNPRLVAVLSKQVVALRAYLAESVWTFGARYEDSKSGAMLGLDYGCDIEFWDYSEMHSSGLVTAPRENVAARILSVNELLPATTEVAGRTVPSRSVFHRRMLDDIVFPIDAVYTWVDGEDPDWVDSKRRTEAEITGIAYHGEANHVARFRSRDELKYSLRSLEMYAPWFRHIYIVTAGQIPEWLNTDHPKVKLIDHHHIYPDSSYLPTFNSNSIISRLHHIEGLSEHYVYINDDVFFGRPLAKDRFFLPSGIAKVSPSRNRRPFGAPTALDEPHLNLTRNMRALLEEEFSVTISRAIKHTPHPQLRSVHFEMEAKFADAYERTWSSRFRHHQDIVADQLHHYYAQIVGKAVPTNLRYNYINILDDQYRGTMESTLRLRHRDTFCINDAPVDGAVPIPEDEVNNFLTNYFPVKSTFEK